MLTVKELCELLRVTRHHVYREMREGRLKALRMGAGGRQWRFRRTDVEEYLVGGVYGSREKKSKSE